MGALANLFEDSIRNLSGSLGIRLRRFYYKRRLKYLGKAVTIDTGVFFVNHKFISIGDGVWIDKNCLLIAGCHIPEKDQVKKGEGLDYITGELRIGKSSHIGIGTIIQAHGTVIIGSYFTSSAHCRIYSYSNDYRSATRGTMPMPNESYWPKYKSGEVIIGENVWLGLSVSLISSSIGDNVFVMPHSVVSKLLNSNIVASGNPALPIKKRFE